VFPPKCSFTKRLKIELRKGENKMGFYCLIGLIAVVVCYFLIPCLSTMATTITWVITEASEGAGIGSYVTCSTDGNDVLSSTIPVPITTTNLEKEIVFDPADLAQIIITTTADVTMYTNAASGGSPDETITLKAGYPFVWIKNSGITIPLGTPITSLFFTNASGVNAAVVRIRGVQNL